MDENEYSITDNSLKYSSVKIKKSQNNSNNEIKMKELPRQKIKDQIRNHLFNSKIDKPLYDGNYPIIISTISDTESDTNTNYTFSSNLNNSRNNYSLSHPSNSSHSHKNKYINNNRENDMTMLTPDMSEKIKNNHIALNTENIDLSQNNIYNYINKNNNDGIDNKSISSSQYTNNSNNTGYYTYTSSSYFMSDVDYLNGSESEYFGENSKQSDNIYNSKQDKYKDSNDNSNNLNQFLIYKNNEKQSKINTSINSGKEVEPSISSSSISHHHHRHHHKRNINGNKVHSIVIGNEDIDINKDNIEDNYYRRKKIQNFINSQNLKNKKNGKKEENYNKERKLPNDSYLSDIYSSTYTEIESEFDKLSFNNNNELIKEFINTNDIKLENDQDNITNMTSSYKIIKSVSASNNVSNNNTIKSSNFKDTLKSSSNEKESISEKQTIFDIANNYVNSKVFKQLDVM